MTLLSRLMRPLPEAPMTPPESSAPVVFRPSPTYVGFDPNLRLSVTFLPGGRVRVDRSFRFFDAGQTRVIPEGFVSDGMSGLAITWMFIGHPYSYSLLPPSLGHDRDLEMQRVQRRDSRLEVDRRYYRALRSWGVGRVRAGLIYMGVRAKALLLRRTWDAVPSLSRDHV